MRRLVTWLILAALSVLIGLLVAFSGWALPAVAVAGLATAALWRRPVLGIGVVWGTGLVYGVLLRLVDGNSAMLVWKDLLIGLLLMRTLTDPDARDRVRVLPLLPLAAWLLVGVASWLAGSLPAAQAAEGLRATFEWPVMLVLGAAWLDAPRLRQLLGWMLPLVGLNAALALWQSTSSVDQLLAVGYRYFDNVREAGGVVRAFGALPYGIPFAHTMAVLALAYGCLLAGARTRGDRMVALLGAGCAVGGVALAVNRTSLGGLVIAAIATAATLFARLPAGTVRGYLRTYRIPATLGVLAVAGLLVLRGGDLVVQPLVGADASVTARLEQWTSTTSQGSILLGAGPGAVGVAAQEGDLAATIADNAVPAWVVDNYYLAVYVQYGLLGVLLMLTAMTTCWRRLRERLTAATATAWPVLGGTACLAYLAVAMTTLNIWEDYPTPVLLWTMIGAGLAGAGRTSSDERDEPDGREVNVLA